MRNRIFLACIVGAVAASVFAYRDRTSEPEREPEPTETLAPAHTIDTPERIASEHMPPPFADRNVRKPDPTAPAASETAAFCDDENWKELDFGVAPGLDGEFRVDEAAWTGALTNTKAGLASWMSQCRRDGEEVTIVAHSTGERLATYDPQSGLRLER